MTRGRRPDPAAVQIAKGNPRKRGRKQLDAMQRAEDPASQGEPHAPSPSSDVPVEARETVSTAPADLKPAARAVWDELAPELIRLKFLRPTDMPAFKRYCMRLAQFWENAATLDTGDTVYQTETPHGKMYRSHPLFMQQLQIEKRLVDFEDRFGLNPAGRQRLLLSIAARAPGLPFDQPTKNQGSDGEGKAASDGEATPPAPAQGNRPIGFLSPTRLN